MAEKRMSRYRRGHRPHLQKEQFAVAASGGRGNKNRPLCEMGMKYRHKIVAASGGRGNENIVQINFV
jgi:hypothetical protein